MFYLLNFFDLVIDFYILFILVLSVVLLNDDLGNKTMNNLMRSIFVNQLDTI